MFVYVCVCWGGGGGGPVNRMWDFCAVGLDEQLARV